MTRRTPIIALLLGVGLLFGPVAGSMAKSGIIARLDGRLPSGAHPGVTLTIGWTLITPDGRGLIGTDTVLRLFPRNDGLPSDYPVHEDRANHYVASVTVPPGGIATIGIGIPGSSCGPNGCTPAIDFFTVTDHFGAPINRPGAIRPPETGTALDGSPTGPGPSAALIVSLLLGAAVAADTIWRSVADRRRRRPRSGVSTGSRPG
jgi:hypothetical protein